MQPGDSGYTDCYYNFLQGIGEENLPIFTEEQVSFLKYASSHLPLVRPHELLIISALLEGAKSKLEIDVILTTHVKNYSSDQLNHALKYMVNKHALTVSDADITVEDFLCTVEYNYPEFHLTINKAIMGSTITKGEKVFERTIDAVIDSSGDKVILEFGGNDCDYDWKSISENPYQDILPKTPLVIFRKEYCNLIEMVRKNGKEPILLSLPPIDSKKYFNWITRINSRRH